MTKELTTRDEFDLGIDLSDMMMIIMMIVMMSVMASVASTVTTSAQTLQAQVYQGRTDTRELNASSELKWIDLIHDHPYTGWVWANLANKGPNPVKIAINYPDETFTIASKGNATVDRIGAIEKINIVFYQCDPGETAAVTAMAEY